MLREEPELSPMAKKALVRARADVVVPVPPLAIGRVPVTPPEPLAARSEASAVRTPEVKVIPVPAISD